MVYVSPAFGAVQSCGTATPAQSYSMPVAARPTTCLGTSGHGRQTAREPGAAGVGLTGPGSESPLGASTGRVQPAMVRTVASRPTARRGKRGTRAEPSGRGRGARTEASRSAAHVSAAGQHLGQVERDRPLELLVRAGARIAVRPPALELGGVPEPEPLHVVVPHLDHALRTQRRERQVLAVVPPAVLVLPRRPLAL